jgi:2-dehydro-3-deoxy-D-arabinonate dehydratase
MVYRLYKTKDGVLVEHKEKYYLLKDIDWNQFLNDDDLYQKTAAVVLSASDTVDGSRLIREELLL